jgi:hypothetical protein
MPRSVSRSIRYAFVALSGVLLLVAGIQSTGAEDRMGLSACGWEGNPCVMEELVVKAPPASEAEDAGLPAEVARSVDHARPVAVPVPAAQS